MPPHPVSKPGRRAWQFRFAAIALGILPFLVAEGFCVLSQRGVRSVAEDPLVGFSYVVPLFELNEERTRYEIAQSRRKFFAADSFLVEKPSNGVRIFCLGGSTVQGNPYSIETSFTTFLRLALEAADSSREWEVVNCGGVSYASYRLTPILEECLRYRPDLIILCVGHNEFLEDRSYPGIRRIPESLHRPLCWLSQSRLAGVIQNSLFESPSARSRRSILSTEIDAILDHRQGLESYRRDPQWANGVALHYEDNLKRMSRLARRADVPLLLIRPPCNLGDCPPFKSESTETLTAEQAKTFAVRRSEAQANFACNPRKAAELLAQACALDSSHALAWYELGHCRQACGDRDGARQAYLRARDEDVCPLRMTTPLETALFRVADQERRPVLDAFQLIEAQSQDGILDGYWLVDHVHPSIEGHQIIALSLLEELERLYLVRPRPDWKNLAQAAFKEHYESLDRTYFHRGNRHLEALRHWTQGNTFCPPEEPRIPERETLERPGD